MAKGKLTDHIDWKRFRTVPGRPARLGQRPTEIEKLCSDEKCEEHLAEFKAHLLRHQSELRADGRYGILVIFQGMDTSGKDSAIKHVMSGLNPLGASATAFGVPSHDERHHDFLWRTHMQIPARGNVGIFNRSYYEEVLIVRVHPELLTAENLPPEHTRPERLWRERLEDIRNHEAYLYRQGYRLVKIFLHISKSRQKERLLARFDDPSKNWKIDPNDIDERALWGRYEKAYEEALSATSTKEAPWYVVPADDKKTAWLIISEILHATFKQLPLAWPEASPQRRAELRRLRARLERG